MDPHGGDHHHGQAKIKTSTLPRPGDHAGHCRYDRGGNLCAHRPRRGHCRARRRPGHRDRGGPLPEHCIKLLRDGHHLPRHRRGHDLRQRRFRQQPDHVPGRFPRRAFQHILRRPVGGRLCVFPQCLLPLPAHHPDRHPGGDRCGVNAYPGHHPGGQPADHPGRVPAGGLRPVRPAGLPPPGRLQLGDLPLGARPV